MKDQRYIPSHLNAYWGEWLRQHFYAWSIKVLQETGKKGTQKLFTDEVNKHTSVSAPTVSNWLKGKYAPENEPFLAVCKVLDLKPDEVAEYISSMPTLGEKTLTEFFRPNANYQRFKRPSEAKKHTQAAWNFIGEEFGEDHHVMYVTGENGLQLVPESIETSSPCYVYTPQKVLIRHDKELSSGRITDSIKKTNPDFEMPKDFYAAVTRINLPKESTDGKALYESVFERLGPDDIKFVEQLGEELAEYTRIRIEQYKQMCMYRADLTNRASEEKIKANPESDGVLTKKEKAAIEKKLIEDSSFQIGRTPDGNLVSYKIDHIDK